MKAFLIGYGLASLFVCVGLGFLLAKLAPRRLVRRDGQGVNLSVPDLISLVSGTAGALALFYLWGWPLQSGLLLMVIPFTGFALSSCVFSAFVLRSLRAPTKVEPASQDAG